MLRRSGDRRLARDGGERERGARASSLFFFLSRAPVNRRRRPRKGKSENRKEKHFSTFPEKEIATHCCMLSLPRCKPTLSLSCSSSTRRITSSLGQSSSSRSSSRSRRKRQSTPKRFSSNRSKTAVDDDDLNNLDLKLSSPPPPASIMPVKREPSAAVLAIWRSAKAVCFDVDSTLCTDESIDEIAAFLGVGEQVAALTSQLSILFFVFLFVVSLSFVFPCLQLRVCSLGTKRSSF